MILITQCHGTNLEFTFLKRNARERLRHMTITAIVLTCGGLAGALVTIITLIFKFDDLKARFKTKSDKRRAKFAMKQQPFCQSVCPAPKYMQEIAQILKDMKKDNLITREISLETLGTSLIKNADECCKRGWCSQEEKDNLIHAYIPYEIGGGNGRVLYHVGLAMNLPTSKGGTPCDVDMSLIIEREHERYRVKHNERNNQI